MFSLNTLILLLVMAALVWFWFDSRRAWEITVRICEHTCRDMNLQFLDETVSLSGFGLARNSDGRLQLMRQFQFEFSSTGADRRQGRATMLGGRVEAVQLDNPDGTTLITPQYPGVHRLQ
jgi:Protein of unknown function (DUF3301)